MKTQTAWKEAIYEFSATIYQHALDLDEIRKKYKDYELSEIKVEPFVHDSYGFWVSFKGKAKS